MSHQRRKDLFRQTVEGNLDAAKELGEYLRVRGAQAAAGDAGARTELEELAYAIAYDKVAERMRRDFCFLLDRHSAASVLHEAWLRVLGPSPQPIDDPVSLCRRIGYMVHFALLDIVASQRKWILRHHAQSAHGAPEANSADYLDQMEGASSLDPSRRAAWRELHERIETLPDEQRSVLMLHFHLEMSRARIAELLDVTEHRVRVLLLEALQRLGHVLRDFS